MSSEETEEVICWNSYGFITANVTCSVKRSKLIYFKCYKLLNFSILHYHFKISRKYTYTYNKIRFRKGMIKRLQEQLAVSSSPRHLKVPLTMIANLLHSTSHSSILCEVSTTAWPSFVIFIMLSHKNLLAFGSMPITPRG